MTPEMAWGISNGEIHEMNPNAPKCPLCGQPMYHVLQPSVSGWNYDREWGRKCLIPDCGETETQQELPGVTEGGSA
jgi:hypothetical protein